MLNKFYKEFLVLVFTVFLLFLPVSPVNAKTTFNDFVRELLTNPQENLKTDSLISLLAETEDVFEIRRVSSEDCPNITLNVESAYNQKLKEIYVVLLKDQTALLLAGNSEGLVIPESLLAIPIEELNYIVENVLPELKKATKVEGV